MRRSIPSSSPRGQRGVSLIEVLIAVLIMGVGLLGIAAMQATALRNSQSALQRSQAVMHTYAILDAMRANLDVARTNGYNRALGCTIPAAGGLAATDINIWMTAIQATLGPTACGGITCLANQCLITVRWDDGLGTAGSATQQLQTRSRI